MKSLAIFCGSSDSVPSYHLELAYLIGSAIAQRKIEIIYGAGVTGLMGQVANGALAQGGRVTGVIPHSLDGKEITHPKLTLLEKVDSFATRKARMNELSEAFLILPGGIGTLDELFEMWTERQLAYHDKPIYLINFEDFYSPLLDFFKPCESLGYMHSNAMSKIRCFDSAEKFLIFLDEE